MLEVEIVNRDYPQRRTVCNAIAEIPGTDKADEVIMLGGYFNIDAGTGRARGASVFGPPEAAAVVYQLAMRDELLPRFPEGEMAARPGGQ